MTNRRRYRDLGKDLGSALSADFDYQGNFYFAENQHYHPQSDPEITVEGLGRVEVPLTTKKQADSIIQFARQSPFGKGEETVVDTTVRDTWEIDGSKITIGNAKWKNWLETRMIKRVCRRLGVDMTKTSPRLELCKLLLYTKGSHFLAHQDTKKTEGMFATLVVDLPAPHTGGDVVLSLNRSGEQERISWDISNTDRTCILAWYTDVVHEVEPITGGHRLVLSYNLVHAKPNSISHPAYQPPVPLTDDAKTAKLRRVLKGWDQGKYPQKIVSTWWDSRRRPALPFFAYVLDHNYSANDLSPGLSCLKGADDHKLSLLAPLAKEFNVKIALANLEHEVWGDADDRERHDALQDLRYWQRQWEKESDAEERRDKEGRVTRTTDEQASSYESDEEAEAEEYDGPVAMASSQTDHESTYTFSNFYTLDGEPLIRAAASIENDTSKSGQVCRKDDNDDGMYGEEGREKPRIPGTLELDGDYGVVIPKGVFETESPDKEEYERGTYMGNECGSLTYWYHRAVVIMYHERDEAQALSIFRDGL
ncbi:2OG-Fe(II) oxygenase [Coprinopsis sp. MPI-PUGE-AT-0042]|nr:2OG-Fe(II) oxygenase [Coprinopsis sp. MPI-PUGE-AT-0042]